MKSQQQKNKVAFTLMELLMVIVIIAVLAVLLLPLSPRAPEKANRIKCSSNLKQISLAYILWATDQSTDGAPPFRVPVADGGTLLHELGGNAWFQYAWISNELSTPKVLVCPSDKTPGLQMATHWGNTSDGGFLNNAYRANAISYSLNVDAGIIGPPSDTPLTSVGALVKASPQHVLLSDYNFSPHTTGNVCSALAAPAAVTIYDPAKQAASIPAGSVVGFTNNVHKMQGNVALLDGSVHLMNNKTFFEQVIKSDDNGRVHFLPAH